MKKNVPSAQLPVGILPIDGNQLPLGLQFLRHTGPQMDSEKDIRIAVLKQVRDTDFDGVQAKMAEILGVQPDYLSRVLMGKKGLGGDAARQWEERLGKPKYFLDGVSMPSGIQQNEPEALPQAQITALADQIGELVSLFLMSGTEARKMVLHSAREAAGDTANRAVRRRNKS